MPEQPPQSNEKARIAAINDEFRRARPNGDWIATVGALALSDFPGLVEAVRQFDDFTEENDPWGERDFGAIDWQGERTFWKLDYFDQNLQYWHDPLSPECRRGISILLASEY